MASIPTHAQRPTGAEPVRSAASPSHEGPVRGDAGPPSAWQESPRQLQQGERLAQLRSAPAAGTPARGGLPEGLQRGIETLSGMDMSGVRVHRNSAKPAALQAHAYAQGQDIHLGPGQEKHLPHEAWHVVQQAQGRVKPTRQMKRGVAVNDDAGLEREADLMGARAMQLADAPAAHGSGGTGQQGEQAELGARRPAPPGKALDQGVSQRVVYGSEAALWAAAAPSTTLHAIRAVINGNGELQDAYEDSLANLARMNFVDSPGTQPIASFGANPDGTYNITFGQQDTQTGRFAEVDSFVSAIIHEMGHVNSGLQYQTNVPEGEGLHNANMHLPVAAGPVFEGTQVAINQVTDPVSGSNAQIGTMDDNWEVLTPLRTTNHGFTADEIALLASREQYARGVAPASHYDTVLVDILYLLQHRGLTETHYYLQATAMLQEANLRRRNGHGVVQPVALQPAPANDFLTLYNTVRGKLLEARWNDEGEAFIGKKIPNGVRTMRALLDPGAKRESLDALRAEALRRIAAPDKRRSPATTALYNEFSQLDLRSNFAALIGNIQAI